MSDQSFSCRKKLQELSDGNMIPADPLSLKSTYPHIFSEYSDEVLKKYVRNKMKATSEGGSKRPSSAQAIYGDFKKKKLSESKYQYSDESNEDEEPCTDSDHIISKYINEKLQECLIVLWNLPSGVRKVSPKLSHDGKILTIKYTPSIETSDVEEMFSGEVIQRSVAVSVSEYLEFGKAEKIIMLPFACQDANFKLIEPKK